MSKGKIAPHEGREVQLVLDGDKPLAVVERDKDPDQFFWIRGSMRNLEAAGLVIQPRLANEGVEYVISQSYSLIYDYLWLLQNGVQRLGLKEYHRRMGRLFGYTEADIEAFIAAEIDCDCSKCTGTYDSEIEFRVAAKLADDARKARTYDFTGGK